MEEGDEKKEEGGSRWKGGREGKRRNAMEERGGRRKGEGRGRTGVES